MNARQLAHKLARRCQETGVEVALAPYLAPSSHQMPSGTYTFRIFHQNARRGKNVYGESVWVTEYTQVYVAPGPVVTPPPCVTSGR